MTFGERLRELREERDVTQKALAEVLGVSPRMVSFYESGAHFLSDGEQLCRLADYFDVTTDYLLGRSALRSPDQAKRFNMLLTALPEAERKSIMDYSEYLLSRHRRSQK